MLHWYEIRSVLGEGGFGVIYNALDRNLGQPVAIKEFFPTNLARRGANGSLVVDLDGRNAFEWGLKRFVDEARILASLRHPGIVRVLSVFEANGSAYIAMEMERGDTFGKALESGLVSEEPMLLRLVSKLLSGLGHLHEAGIVHRDLKPDNVMIRPDKTPVILDLRAARALTIGSNPMTAVLTRGYAPFEQYDESGTENRQGPWTDIYSLGALLYRAVTGQPPPDAMDRANALLRGDEDPCKSAVDLCVGKYSEGFLKAIDASLQFSAEDRPQSVASWSKLFPAPEPLEEPAGLVTNPHITRGSTTSGVEATPIDLQVLVVDDEPVARNLASRVLKRVGVRDVAMVDSGAAALEWVSNHGVPQVLVCDLDMPQMDGLELLRHLAERRQRPAVVLVSAYDQSVLRAARTLARAHGLTVLGSVEKPINPRFVRRLLEEFQIRRNEVEEGPPTVLSPLELTDGLADGRLEVVYQPLVWVADNRLAGMEALARWRHPVHGVLGPSAFIGVAEEVGVMNQLTDQVMDAALEACGNWCLRGPEMPVCINISVESLDLDLPERIVGSAEAYGMSPELITLELTENRVMKNAAAALEGLTRLRLKHVGLAIDDFGTGYSSLEQLSKVPFTRLKIDRAFVTGAASDPATFAILESSAELGANLGMELVAEGVESQADWDTAASVGCDIVQGYFVARPMDAEDVPGWATRWESLHA